MGAKQLASVQELLPLEDVIGDVLCLRGGDYRAVLEAQSINFALKSEAEQEGIIAGYRAFLNAITYPLQVLVRILPTDVEVYLDSLRSRPALRGDDTLLVSESTRHIVGQPRSTWDPRPLIKDGGVLVVNSAVGVLGEGAAALLGATILNLLSLLIEEQVSLPPSQRTRVVALVDESSTLGAADYPRMLSELAKYGAGFTLVTQSLAKLDAIDDGLRPTLFSNIDGLTVFQTSAQDARYLASELGGDLDIPDLTGLDDYECYARWWTGGHKLPPFSFRIDPPQPSNKEKAARIARSSAERYGRPRAVVATEIAGILKRREPPSSKPPAKPQTSSSTSEAASNAEEETAPEPQPAAPNPTPQKHGRNQRRDQRVES